jgi:hypothetical protein
MRSATAWKARAIPETFAVIAFAAALSALLLQHSLPVSSRSMPAINATTLASSAR